MGYRRRGNTFRRGARSYMGRRRYGRRRRFGGRNAGGVKIEINHKDMVFTKDPVAQEDLSSAALITPVSVTGSAAMTHITAVNRGDSEEERVGGRYKCISLEIKGNITQAAGSQTTADGDAYDNHVHIVLVEKKNTQGTQIVPSNVFDTPNNPLRVHDQVDDYKVIWHKELKFHAVKDSSYLDGTETVWPNEVRDFHMYTKLWQQVDFTNVATSAITECRTSSLHLFAWTEFADDGTAPNEKFWPPVNLNLRGRLRFIDC